jgi:hypothetical protein
VSRLQAARRSQSLLLAAARLNHEWQSAKHAPGPRMRPQNTRYSLGGTV